MIPYVDIPFRGLANSLGVSVDIVKLLVSFLISYPFAAALKRIPDERPGLKNGFITSIAIFYLIGLFDLWDGLRTILISSVGAYSIAAYGSGPFMPWIAFVFLMSHLSINQISRQILNDDAVVDVTGAQMIMVLKLTAFCWNVADGRLPDSELSDFQRERAIKKLPGLLDYGAYVLFFPALFAGPAFDYVEYKQWIETTMFDPTPGSSLRAPTRKQRKIPRSGTPATWKALAGLTWIALFVKLSSLYNKDYLLSPAYTEHGLMRRIWILHMVGFTARLRYYGVWALTEGSCILTGLGYKGVDPTTGRISWDRLRNVDPWGVETAQNTRAYLGSWNLNTNHWLRNYVYLRVTPRGKKPGFRASMATFITSSVWHGFYPGYYLTGVMATFAQTIGKNGRRYIRPFFLDAQTLQPTAYKLCYDLTTYFLTQVTFSFVVAPFYLLHLQEAFMVFGRVDYYAVIGIIAAMLFFASPARPWLIAMRDRRSGVKKEQPGAVPKRNDTTSRGPTQGVPLDPQEDLAELVGEIKAEVEARRRQGIWRADTAPG